MKVVKKMKNILLICGSGASSGFMAAAIRKAAKKRKVEVTVKAASESQLDDRINETASLVRRRSAILSGTGGQGVIFSKNLLLI